MDPICSTLTEITKNKTKFIEKFVLFVCVLFCINLIKNVFNPIVLAQDLFSKNNKE